MNLRIAAVFFSPSPTHKDAQIRRPPASLRISARAARLLRRTFPANPPRKTRWGWTTPVVMTSTVSMRRPPASLRISARAARLLRRTFPAKPPRSSRCPWAEPAALVYIYEDRHNSNVCQISFSAGVEFIQFSEAYSMITLDRVLRCKEG